MENERIIETESDRFTHAATALKKIAAKSLAEMAEEGYGDGKDYAATGYLCQLLVESVNVIKNLEFRINELSKEVDKLKK